MEATSAFTTTASACECFAGFQTDPDRAASSVIDEHFGGRRRQARAPTQSLEEGVHALDDGVHTASCKPHAALALQIGHDRVDRARAKRIAADEQRMEAKHHTQAWVADEARDEVVDALRRVQAQELRRELREGAELMKGLARQILECSLVQRARRLHQALIADNVRRVESSNLRFDLRGCAAVVEVSTIGKVHAVVRLERNQLDIVVQPGASTVPEVFE